MIPTNLSPVAKQLPEYLFYKLPNNKGYRMFTTKPTAISHTFDLNIGKKTLTDAINLKFDRDYKGTQLIKNYLIYKKFTVAAILMFLLSI